MKKLFVILMLSLSSLTLSAQSTFHAFSVNENLILRLNSGLGSETQLSYSFIKQITKKHSLSFNVGAAYIFLNTYNELTFVNNVGTQLLIANVDYHEIIGSLGSSYGFQTPRNLVMYGSVNLQLIPFTISKLKADGVTFDPSTFSNKFYRVLGGDVSFKIGKILKSGITPKLVIGTDIIPKVKGASLKELNFRFGFELSFLFGKNRIDTTEVPLSN